MGYDCSNRLPGVNKWCGFYTLSHLNGMPFSRKGLQRYKNYSTFANFPAEKCLLPLFCKVKCPTKPATWGFYFTELSLMENKPISQIFPIFLFNQKYAACVRFISLASTRVIAFHSSCKQASSRMQSAYPLGCRSLIARQPAAHKNCFAQKSQKSMRLTIFNVLYQANLSDIINNSLQYFWYF